MDIKNTLYNYLVIEKNDYKRIDKIINAYESGKLTKENYWNTIGKFTKDIKTDHNIKRWQIIAEGSYKYLFEEAWYLMYDIAYHKRQHKLKHKVTKVKRRIIA